VIKDGATEERQGLKASGRQQQSCTANMKAAAAARQRVAAKARQRLKESGCGRKAMDCRMAAGAARERLELLEGVLQKSGGWVETCELLQENCSGCRTSERL
jgi:hypothetical protein